jgi:hypothetical protein
MNNTIALAAILLFAPFAQAQSTTLPAAEGTSTSTVIKTETVNKQFNENQDITDAKLKADGGSLSRYSLKFNLTYAGGVLSNLSEKDQPNPDGTLGSFQTSLGGSMGARYRIDSKSTVGISTGVKMIHPFHGAERTDLTNPSLTYDRSFRAGSVQMKNTPGFVYRTVPEFTRAGQYGMIYDNHSMVYDIGKSGFSIGVDMALGAYMYSRDYEKTDGKAGRYTFEFNPNLKYNFNDKTAMVTQTQISWWNPRARDDQFALLNRTVTQKLGLGHAVTRDIYLNPYLNFYPQHLAWSGVTLNMTTIFSVF